MNVKLSRLFYIIGAIFIVVVLVVSGLFVYNTAYGTLKNMKLAENGFNYSNTGISMNFTVSGINKGFMSERIIIGNSSIEFPPGYEVSKSILFSIPLSSLNKYGWPENNVTVPESLPIELPGYLFTITTKLEHNFTIGAPVYGFNVTNVKPVEPENYSISVSFTYFTQVSIPSGQIIIYNGTQPIGNISFNSLAPGTEYNLTGSFYMKNAPSTVDLSFRMGPISWSVKNVRP